MIPPHNDSPTIASTLAESPTGIRVAFDITPDLGVGVEVAKGVWWIRLPLTASVGHVNVYLLEDEHGWTLVDTGTNADICRSALLETLAAEPFSRLPLKRVIATHFHPDHIGLAGEFAKQGVSLWTTRLTWLLARMFQLDDRPLPYPEHVAFAERAGLKGTAMAVYCRRPGSDYRNLVTPLPSTYTRLYEGEVLTIGARQWRVILGHGHAPEHVTLWSDDGLVITGDQLLLGLSSNLSVHPSDPDAELIGEWVDSCTRLMSFADDHTICLPGHNLPFCGVLPRCQQLLATQEAVLNRLLECLSRPQTTVECLPTVYRRHLQPYEMGTLMAEAMGFLNYLHRQGLVQRELAPDNSYLWSRSRAINSQFQLRLQSSDDSAVVSAPRRLPR